MCSYENSKNLQPDLAILLEASSTHRWYFCAIYIANIAQRTFKIVQKLRLHGHGDIIISTSMSTMSPEISMCEVPSDVLLKLRADFVCDNGIIEVSLLHI